ncbi:glycoside hydrolase family 61 protein [Peziza echinospora]|nr:glycoside hydrolase family 61 protein [Peziza echinospora]
MKLTVAFVAAAFIAGAQAHTRVWGVHINGNFQGDGRGTYIRSPPTNNPIKEINTTINCNVNNNQVGSQVQVKAGDTYTVEWYHDTRNDDIIAASHKGPHVFYIAAASSGGNGAVWTKLAEDGLSGGKWAVEKLIANGGKASFTIPSWIAPGDYLIRAEIIALHESEVTYQQNPVRGTQFYPSCQQVKITAGGSTKPAQNFNFVGGYKYTDPGILYNIYTIGGYPPYTIPGPSVWVPTTSGGGTGGGSSGSVAKYGQCGGTGYTGATGCVSGTTCVVVNPYYSQCQ